MGGEEPVGPAVDGSTEADQVRLFLGKEHELVQMVFSEEEGQVCVGVSVWGWVLVSAWVWVLVLCYGFKYCKFIVD